MVAMAGRRASHEVVTTTHIRACSPQQHSLRHTPHEGLGALSGPANDRVTLPCARRDGRIAGAFHLRCSGSQTPFSAYHNAVSPSRWCTPPRLKPAPSGQSRANPASATDRAETAAMANTTIPATFHASVGYSSAKPRRSSARPAGPSAIVTAEVCTFSRRRHHHRRRLPPAAPASGGPAQPHPARHHRDTS
jgi:hypothetical protein